MSVVLSVQEVGPCRKQLRVEIPAPAVDAETAQVVREWGRRARIPGFRKGHVPASVVRSRFKDEIEREVVDRLLPAYWKKAQAERDLRPLAPPEVDEVGALAAGEALTFVASVEVRPEIELGDLGGFDLPDPPVDPGDDEIAEALDELRRGVADWRPAERPAARGDRVTARITEVATDGDDEEGQRPTPPETVTVEIGDANVWEELSLALTGLAVGQEGRFTRRPAAEDAPARSFRVAVDKVEERDLPPLDDALAARIGKFDSVDALRAEVEAGLHQRNLDRRRRERETALLEQLRARYPVVLPPGVVRHETDHLLRDYADELGRRGLDPRAAKVDWQGLGEQLRPQAERHVHDRLLLDAVAERESIAVADDELEAAVSALARAQGTNPGLLRRRLADDGRLDGLREQLQRRKTLRHLLGEEAEEAEEEAGSDRA